MAYLTASGIEWLNQHLAGTHPFCHLITLPEPSIEGRTIRAIRISAGTATNRNGILLIGGVHARELVNPDMLITFSFQICAAYKNNTGLTYGGKTYTAALVKLFMENLDIVVLPLVNPDGRIHVQSPTGDSNWRKNRNPNPGSPCTGVDLNRNFDFLWSSGIGTSANPCNYQTYKGTYAFSEPEVRNVRYLLDVCPNINCFVDVHSYSELVLYPWGDDENQTANASMNFQNAGYNGMRGTVGDTAYKEYIPSADRDNYIAIANNVRDDIAAVRGRSYTAKQSVGLYPTSGTSEDYAFTRSFVSSTKRKVLGFTMETGTVFQPGATERAEVIKDGSAGVATFCLRCACLPKPPTTPLSAEEKRSVIELGRLREMRDEVLAANPATARYVQLIQVGDLKILDLLMSNDALRRKIVDVVPKLKAIVRISRDDSAKTFPNELMDGIEKIVGELCMISDGALRENLQEIQDELKYFKGNTLDAAAAEVSRAREMAE